MLEFGSACCLLNPGPKDSKKTPGGWAKVRFKADIELMVGDDPASGLSDCRHREETMPLRRETPDNRDFQIEDPNIHDDRQYAGELHHLEILHPTLILAQALLSTSCSGDPSRRT